ncbi:hypothetical protein [Burkholderia pseudomallei]|uniref:hypothetical protein n=1 Tax=Burkholderia pseudomallei TaxID=28450 RepID=UPI0011AFAEF0|nr:hypothetical protein [Burkholderia pseudomallei]
MSDFEQVVRGRLVDAQHIVEDGWLAIRGGRIAARAAIRPPRIASQPSSTICCASTSRPRTTCSKSLISVSFIFDHEQFMQRSARMSYADLSSRPNTE